MKAKLLHESLAAATQFGESILGLIRGNELEHFHLIELVAPDRAAFLGAVAACLPAIAGSIGKCLDRQFPGRKNLVSVDIQDRGLGGGQQERGPFALPGLNVKNIVIELGELSRSVA